MSPPVDVLAVLDDHMRVHGRNGCPQHQRELLVVRNALAELIEAGDAFWRATDFGRKACSPAIAKRFDAAADRVKGGAA